MPLRFLLGAQKGGTSSVWQLLVEKFGACPIAKSDLTFNAKESHLLTGRWDNNSTFRQARARFMSVYPSWRCSTGCFVEATPSNMRSVAAPERLFQMMHSSEASRTRFIVVVREPISRDISWFHQSMSDLSRHGQPVVSYTEYATRAIANWHGCASDAEASVSLYTQCAGNAGDVGKGGVLTYGMYWAQLAAWMARFAREQFLILRSDHMLTADERTQLSLREFFGLALAPSAAVLKKPMPHANPERDYPGKVAAPPLCNITHALGMIFAPWNERLASEFPHLLLRPLNVQWPPPVCTLKP